MTADQKKLRSLFIRAAQSADYKACRTLTNQAANREGFGFVSRITFNDFAQKQATDPRHILQVAVDTDGTVVGYIRALALANHSQVTIHEVCRDQHCKGYGVGSSLVQAVEKYARDNRIPRLFLKSPAAIAAHRAYQRLGFHQIAIENRAAITDKPSARTLIHFEKRLD